MNVDRTDPLGKTAPWHTSGNGWWITFGIIIVGGFYLMSVMGGYWQ